MEKLYISLLNIYLIIVLQRTELPSLSSCIASCPVWQILQRHIHNGCGLETKADTAACRVRRKAYNSCLPSNLTSWSRLFEPCVPSKASRNTPLMVIQVQPCPQSSGSQLGSLRYWDDPHEDSLVPLIPKFL
jgi:hypothetical protein